MRSSSFPRWNYDVFLSFRGEDTRKTFTSHLYEGLHRMGIVTFQDDKRLEHGTSISEELSKAIEESQFAIIIFSKNYASSGWCLDELVKIMKCKSEYEQSVIPVFYDVDPSAIRYQKESFAEAFVKHESRYNDDFEGMLKLQRWRTALTTAANLTGHDIRNRIESECIQQIVNQISSKLRKTSLPILRDLVGVDTHLEQVKSLLKIDINDVRIVGIWGMGGVGKTTIARAIFEDLSYQFEAACFLADVKENKHGMHSLQNALLSELLRKKADYVNNKEDGEDLISSRFCRKRVLIVLDDIAHIDHLKYLAGDVDWFGKGSRIIVTTRNKHLIGNDVVYQLTTLPHHEAIHLFNQHAFKKEVPDEQFGMLSWEVVNHAKGLPLALKVWGSFLHKRDITKWRSAIEQMKKNSNSEIVEKLKISYDGLEPEEQEIFLDVACFFRGYNKDKVMEILESCDFGANIGLDVLIEKSLVFITKDRIEMHDLIQDMGKYVVNMQKYPGDRSRLWLVEDFKEVMINNTGTKAVEAIWINNPQNLQCSRNNNNNPVYSHKVGSGILNMSRKALKNMSRLRILSIGGRDYFWGIVSFHDSSIEYLSNNLRWFVWDYYPLESLPASFEPKRLVHLNLRRSSLRHLWTETKHLPSLRQLDLHESASLILTPDFTGMPNLEVLSLSYCSNLEEIHPSLQYCRKLTSLDLCKCKSLKRFPWVNTESLEYLSVFECFNLEKFPEILGRTNSDLKMDMRHSGIRELPSSIYQYQLHITELHLSSLKNLIALPSNIGMLKSLVELNVSGCSQLESLPEEIGDLENLMKLEAQDTLISRPPCSIARLNKLISLSFGVKKSEGQATMRFLFPRVNEGLRSLEYLYLSYCNLIDEGLPEDIGCLSSLKKLYLSGNNFEHLPRSIAQLGALRLLDLAHCKRLKELPELPPNIDTLWADCHVALKIIHSLATNMKKNLQRVVLTRLYDKDDAYNASIYNLFAHTLFKIFSLHHDITASGTLSQKVFSMEHPERKIPSWFHYYGMDTSVSLNLPENWYICDNFTGFAFCYSGSLIETTAQLIPLCDDGVSWMTWKLALCNHSECGTNIHFFFVPIDGLWDASKANGKTPNDYGLIRLFFSGEMKEFGFRLLYKDEPEIEASLAMRGNNDISTELCVGVRRSRYDNSEHHDTAMNEASCSSSKKQRSHSVICGNSVFENLQQQIEGPISSETLQLFPENTGV